MASKYELTISTEYVSDWGIVESIRELFQNAIDNEITNSENKMYFNYSEEDERLIIGNKTSCLTLDTLLLGSSSKRMDKNTIGTHGEGYKIAFMVLLREGKRVTVYNYGSREIWNTKLVKSRRFGNQLVPCIFVSKEAIWKNTPSHDLMIEVEGITQAEYKDIVESNLHLQESVGKTFGSDKKSRVLVDEKYRGKVFVKGLYICSNKTLSCGYDFAPEVIELDRDRRLIDTFNLNWQTSQLWNDIVNESNKNNEEAVDYALNLIENDSNDTRFITSLYSTGISVDLKNKALGNFIDTYGENSVPVETQEELNYVMSLNRRPVMVKEALAKILKGADDYAKIKVEVKSVKEELSDWLETGVREKLTDSELAEFKRILGRL